MPEIFGHPLVKKEVIIMTKIKRLAALVCTMLFSVSGFFLMSACDGSQSDVSTDSTPRSEASTEEQDSVSGSEEIPETYKGYFKKMQMTEGDILVYGRSENLNTAQRFFAESVQGLSAQKGDSKYYHHRGGAYNQWLNIIVDNYGKTARDVTVAEMIENFKSNIGSGYVLFDSANGESVNCARSIAGIKQVAMIDVSLQTWADTNGLTKLYDATTMTEKECFDTYKDEFDNTGLVQQKGSLIHLTDFAVACKYFCYFVTDKKPTSMQFRNQVQNWCKECAVYGWCPIDEGTDVAFSSTYGSFTLASDYCFNMSMLSCVDFFGVTQLEQPNGQTVVAKDLNKHYITIVNSDGDNLQCWYGGTFEQAKYMGAERGNFSMGWSVSPALYSLAPNILKHTYDNAKAGDRFVCSVSGLGYTYPMSYGADSLARFCTNLNEYIGALDLSVVKILDNGLPKKTIEAYSKMSNAKGFLYCTYSDCYVGEHGSIYWSENGKPFVSCRATMWNSTPQAIASQINAYPKDATTIEGYTYVNLHVWSMDYMDVAEMVALLDENVVVVDPDTFMDLIIENVPHEDVELTE